MPVLPVPESGNIVRVSGSDQLQSALANAKPGDIIMLGNGTYSGNFNLSKNGTEGQPISIRAENPGQAVFRNANVNMSGNYGIVMGAIFDNTGVQINGNHNRVTRNVFRGGKRGTTAVTANKGASHNRIDHNELTDWGHFGFRVLPNDSTKGNRIDHNYIHDYKNVSSKNEPEAIQIGSGRGNTYMNTGTVIENNLIERVEINGEMISIKSSNTTLRGNTVRNEGMRGTVNGRHGTNNTFANNTFIDVHDVAIRGDDHRMIGNRFVGTDLTVPSGDCTQNQVPTGGGCHPSSRNQLVAGNILEGGGKIDIGGGCCKGGNAAQNITLAGNQGSVARGGPSAGVQTSGSFSGNAGQPVVMTRGQVGPAAAGDGVSGGQAGNCEDGGMQQAGGLAGGGSCKASEFPAGVKVVTGENFETSKFTFNPQNTTWSSSNGKLGFSGACYDYNVAVVDAPCADGKNNKAMRLISRMGDDMRNCKNFWNFSSMSPHTGKPIYTHRVEVDPKGAQLLYGKDYWFRMRVYVPEDFPDQIPMGAGAKPHGGNQIMTVSQVIASQVSSPGTDYKLSLSSRTPGPMRWTMEKIGDLGPVERGKWVEWVIHLKRSTGPDGILEVWKNGQKVGTHKGRTTTDNAAQGNGHFKYGMYGGGTGAMGKDFILYFDDVQIGSGPN